MLIAWKHPDQPMPDDPTYSELEQCNDATRPLGVVTIVNPYAYKHFVDGVEWVFGEQPDGTIVHLRRSDCESSGGEHREREVDDDVAPASVSDGQEAVPVEGAGEGGDHHDPAGG